MSSGRLTLSWQASTDNAGVDHYELYLGDLPLARVAADTTTVSVRAFDPSGQSVYTVRAIDAAGNQSGILASVDVTPVPRPAAAPKRIPTWAWKLLRWRERAHHGARPKTPSELPAWYTRWTAWRLEPFQLAA